MKFMDLLFSRYASPFILLNNIMETNRLSEFIDTLVEQDEESKLWQMYLQTIYTNKVSFNDFINSLRKSPQNEKMTGDEIEAILNDSMDILDSFNPTE